MLPHAFIFGLHDGLREKQVNRLVRPTEPTKHTLPGRGELYPADAAGALAPQAFVLVAIDGRRARQNADRVVPLEYRRDEFPLFGPRVGPVPDDNPTGIVAAFLAKGMEPRLAAATAAVAHGVAAELLPVQPGTIASDLLPALQRALVGHGLQRAPLRSEP